MQIPYSILWEPHAGPSLNSVLNRQDGEEPRTTSAAIAVAAHIRSFYQLFATIGSLLIMISFGIITIIFGYIKRKTCSDSKHVFQMFIVFGIMDLIICGIVIIIISARVTCCYRRSNLVCCLSFFGLVFVSMVFLVATMIVTEGTWIQKFLGVSSYSENYNANCENSARYFIWLITICVLFGFCSPVVCVSTIGCGLQREQAPDSTVHFTTLA